MNCRWAQEIRLLVEMTGHFKFLARFLAGIPTVWVAAMFAFFAASAGIWSLPPIDRDESRFAQATAQMIEGSDYVVIRYQDTERNKKPAGIYWLQAASVSLFSDVKKREIWAYRIPSVIGAVLASVFTFLTAQRLYDQRTALLAALLISSAPILSVEASVARTDAFLLACICLAQYAFIQIYARLQEGRAIGWRWPALFWLAQTAGIFIKGPIILLISALTGLGLSFGKPHFQWIKPLRPVFGFVILAIFILPWALAINAATEGRFLVEAIGGDMLSKLAGAQENHSGPFGYHTLLVWFMFWPAAALLLPGIIGIWRERTNWQERILIAWIVPSWIVFELAATKLPHYVLPVFPALAIIAARAAVDTVTPTSKLRRIGAVIYGVISLVAAGFILAFPIYLQETANVPWAIPAAATIGISGVFVASLFWRGRAYHGGIAACILAAILSWIVLDGVFPRLSSFTVASRISSTLEAFELHPLKNDTPQVAVAGYSEPSAVFLLGTDTILTNGADAASRLEAGEIAVAIIDQTEQNEFLSHATTTQTPVNALAVIDGVNYSNGRALSLSVYVRKPLQPRQP